jgi:hypothetical protein
VVDLTETKKTKRTGWPKARLAHSFESRDGQDYLVLLLLTAGRLWTTIRAAWPPEKEEYYRSHVGELVNIEV